MSLFCLMLTMVVASQNQKLELPPARKAALRSHFAEFFERGRPKVIRNHVEFAEQAIRVDDTGIKAGGCFSCDTQPFSRVVLREFDNPQWIRHIGFGCVQSGKTLLYLVIPAARHLFEIGENFGVGGARSSGEVGGSAPRALRASRGIRRGPLRMREF